MHHFYFWLSKNVANCKHIHNGRPWTYNSNSAFAELFPYMNKTKIFRVLKNLEDKGVLVKGNFNESVWDKTLWYSFSDFGVNELSDAGYDDIDFVKMNHRDLQSEPTIPDNKHTDNKHIEIEDNKLSSTKKDDDVAFVDMIYSMYPTRCPKRNASLGKSRKDKVRIKRLLKTYTREEIEQVVRLEVEANYGVNYMKNFSTFLNNFPEPSNYAVKTVTQATSSDTLIINGQVYK